MHRGQAELRAPVLVVALALLLAGCAPPPEPISIGFIGGTSGRVADLGIAGRDGVQLAVDLRNQAGGVGGRAVRLLIRDDEQNPEVAAGALRELIDQGVVAVVGPMTSAMAMAMVPIANEAKLLLISPTVSTEDLSGRDDFFFRVGSSNHANAAEVARHHLQRAPGQRRLAVAYDVGNRAYSESWLSGFRTVFEAGGGQLLKTLAFESGGETSLRQVAGELLASNPDGILIVANSVDTALLCQQLRKLGSALPIRAAEWAATERLLELGGKAVEGLMVGQNFNRSSEAPRYLAFREAYSERFHRDPGFGGTLSFDAANVLLEALARRQGEQSVKEALLNVRRFDGLQAPIVFDDSGDVQLGVFMTVVRDGRLALVE
ncbi:ABC transporter substrate-binding protein [Accumulibacter sp.]|uniref:ABC transporter substrate-binding protein n=1 Tax=Accumulibacter sp. TaxID=2053492 RepID=UPI0025CC4641|nr:ABC transporter substrate-binding protein [Accumulibacter sp.]MCM8613737.1 ABC transporter substrate-binding protein [Accumulibacter sp.]MCM8637367.1 ABC transporter substrate-binding protein [Accumulibacter sp.]MCM8640917.1 ABC transporter substrate-binding protein [Accumulibacter sp.]